MAPRTPAAQAEPHDRLTRLEADVGAAIAALERLTVAIESDRVRADERYQRQIEQQDERFSAVFRKIDDTRRVPWAAYSLFAALLLAAVSGWWALQSRDLERVETSLGELGGTVVERIRQGEYERGRTDEHDAIISREIAAIREWMQHQRDETDDRYESMMRMIGTALERLARLEERK